MVQFASAAEKRCRTVLFVYPAAQGATVSLAGSFNDWDPAALPMKYDAARQGYCCQLQLAVGSYEYKIVVNGNWMLDEGNPNFAANDFGTLNSVLVVE